MLSFKTLYEAEFGRITVPANGAQAVGKEFDTAGDQMESHAKRLPGMWEGKDGETAVTLLQDQKVPLEGAGEVFRKTSQVLTDLGSRLKTQQDNVRQTVSEAETRIPAKVNIADGSVTPEPIKNPESYSDAALIRERQRRQSLAKSYANLFKQQLEVARQVDRRAKGYLDRLDQYKDAGKAYNVKVEDKGPGLIKKPEAGLIYKDGKWQPSTEKFPPTHYMSWRKNPQTGKFEPIRDSAGNFVPAFRDPNTGEIIPALVDNRTGRLVTDRQGNPIQVIRDPNYRGDPLNAHLIAANPDADPRTPQNRKPVHPTIKLAEKGVGGEHTWLGDPKGGQSEFLGGDLKHKTTLSSGWNAGAGAEVSDGNAFGKAEIGGNLIKFATEADYGNGPFKAKVGGEALIGANAELEGSIGKDGVNAKAGAFAGAKAKVTGSTEFAGVGVGAEAEGWAGAGAEAEFNLGRGPDGKFHIGGKVGVGLGLGGKVGGNVTIDPKEIVKFANPFD
ncbi:hypothetical protein [Stackebrandtia nassauensis]|uniref:Uncharacterized protein n=1 Tax=Stackebrandtia nassauensis (strain DSM 44728 / CIP 108903 / NRRL B-16338 / NBRC 102104 / LLR-40K-21) TaxID=446470 RepID=D3Q6Y4_STANL|nr:hypothetical protein [Stackebrandtia nassauensis]ADD40383.1 hypothetical protein Snas_0670 [Stackebrandtia nassauensis DSM 44728]